jgi:hypothetical protein
MLEIAHEYSRDLLDFTQKKYGKLQKKGFQATDLLRKGHRVHMSSSTYGKKKFSPNHRVSGHQRHRILHRLLITSLKNRRLKH